MFSRKAYAFFCIPALLLGILSAQNVHLQMAYGAKDVVKLQNDNAPVVTVVDLNRVNFAANVLQEGHDHVEHWIIRFCYDWYEPCSDLTEPFEEISSDLQMFHNQEGVFQRKVRFANVDCGVDKPLCNSQNIKHFPRVVHYHRQRQVGVWNGGSAERDAPRLRKWAEKQLKADIPAATPKEVPNAIWQKANIQEVVGSMLFFVVAVVIHIFLVHRANVKSMKIAEGAIAAPPAAKKKANSARGPCGAGALLPEDWVLASAGVSQAIML